MKVHSLLNEKNWLQNQLACDKHGDIVLHPEIACGWCLIGAIQKVYGSNCDAQVLMFAREISIGGRDPCDIVCDWNDEPGRTFEEVRKVLLKLDL